MVDSLRILATALILCTPVTIPAQDLSERLRADETLIVPGIGAEKLLLSDSAADVASRKGTPERIARFAATEELFTTIFNLPTELKIPYNMIYYYNENKCAIFFHDNRITAIAGLNTNRVTDLPSDLNRGMDSFIFNYGNQGMELKEKSANRACLYPERGIAVFDDGKDGRIDLYLVFPAKAHTK